ncbi:MAG: peptide deformylase [Clostridiales bacterium]|nr:peptide deformylase [Clostridiales bacterium]
MALREIRKKGDEILNKKCKEVTVFDKKLAILLDDMYETMQKHDGVGLAAPQVGILKRAFVVDIGEGRIEIVNPKIVKAEGSQIGQEGCLSVPDVWGDVERPNSVTLEGFDRDGNKIEISGTELLARAFCHEYDHLNGELFTDKIIEEK